MGKAFLGIAIAVALPVVASAQTDSTARGGVSGTVYDSVARAPLAGAQVQMIDPAHPEGMRTATSDAKGRYAIGSVMPGRYLIGFQHGRLDSLGLEMPTRLVDVRAGERATSNLAIPSPATINTAVCGHTGAADSTGLLIGMLRDARTGETFGSGTVQASWQEIVLENGAFGSHREYASAVLSSSGWFGLCGVPAGIDVLVRAFRGADSTGFVTVNVPIAGLARRDFLIGGTAAIHGNVRNERRAPLPNARVGVAGTERMTSSDSSGEFRLAGIPAGSQTIEVRALGYAPDTREVDLTPGSDTTLALALTSVKRVLDTIHVVATRLYSADVNGFLRRKRLGFGTFFDEDQIARRHIVDVYTLLFTVPAVQVVHTGFGRSVLMRGPARMCAPALFLNGMRMPSDLLDQLDLLVRPDEIGGVEVYRAGNSPSEFYSFDGCGSIVIWTRPPLPKPKPG